MATKGTKRDREKLRKRVQDALGDRTQKDLETAAGLSAGTLTRVFGGRRNVDAELIDALAGGLGMPASDLVKGTTFTTVYEPEPAADAALAAEPAKAEPAKAEPAPKPAPAAKAEPRPEPAVAPKPAAPKPAPQATRPPPAAQPPPREEEERFRKRDLPLKIVKFITGLFGG